MKWRRLLTRPMPLISMYYPALVFTKVFKEKFGCGFNRNLCVFKDGKMHSYRHSKDADTFFEHLRKKTLDLEFTRKNLQLGLEYNKKLLQFLENFKTADISNLDQNKLTLLLEEFGQLYTNYWTYYAFAFYLGHAWEKDSKNVCEQFQEEIEYLRTDPAYQKAEKIFLKRFCAEIAKRAFDEENDLLLFAVPDEITNFLRKKKHLSKEVYENRADYSIIHTEEGQIFVLGGERSKEFEREELPQKEIFEDMELTGNSVFRSSILRGAVRIVNHHASLSSIKQGDVLVTRMTKVKFVPYLSKVKAIVTDEGGITCHAAIIAREMGIPCIIGTNYATKVLKDGDLVEVDAGKGIVRKLK